MGPLHKKVFWIVFKNTGDSRKRTLPVLAADITFIRSCFYEYRNNIIESQNHKGAGFNVKVPCDFPTVFSSQGISKPVSLLIWK